MFRQSVVVKVKTSSTTSFSKGAPGGREINSSWANERRHETSVKIKRMEDIKDDDDQDNIDDDIDEGNHR
jgi:hypothetical protein